MSGIQHFTFCRRQWALIHIEQQWQENARTAQGQLDHVRCHDETLSEKRDNVFTVRGMRVFSRKLNLSGACDVVEFHKDKNGISLEEQSGFWLPYPIEYKHGREKETDAEMNRYFARGYTPKVKPGKHCNACSLKSICLPVLCSRADPVSYLRAHIFESEEDTP